MKKYKTSDTLTEGDIVEYDTNKTWEIDTKVYFKAVQMDKTKPCIKQCDMAGMKWHAHCTGLCYRWENGEDFVFVETEVDPKNVTMTETSLSRIARTEKT